MSAVAIEWPARVGWRERLAHPVSLGAAAAIHLGVLAVIWPALSDFAGEGGNAIDSIAVSVVEQVPVMSVPVSAPPDAFAERVEPLVDTPAPVTLEKAEPKLASPPELALALPPEPELSTEAVTLPVKPPEPLIEKQREPAVEPPLEPKQAQQEPATTSPPATAPMPAMTAAEASPAAVKAYGLRISKLLETRKPSSKGLRGRLIIQLVIDAEGRPQSAVVLKSSDKPALDERVLTAVQRLDFPRPPDAMTVKQLTFNVPYDYR